MQPLDKRETTHGVTRPFGEAEDDKEEEEQRSLFRRVSFAMDVPCRKKNACELYDTSTVLLRGTEYPVVAYAELNDPSQLVPLSEVLSHASPPQLTHFVDLGNRCFQCDGRQLNSPYYDLFLRGWTKAVELFNHLLRYEVPLCLEELQREMQRLSRAFDLSLDGLLGCRLTWQVDVMHFFAKEDSDTVPTCSDAFWGSNSFPLFPPSRPLYTAAAVYALLAALVLEIRFQEMEIRVRELLLLSDTDDDERIKNDGRVVEQMRQVIGTAPWTALVFSRYNPLRQHVQGFDVFIVERYDWDNTASHLSILGLLALCKTASVLNIRENDVVQLTCPMVSTLAYILRDQKTMDFVCRVAQMQHVMPIVKREERRPFSVASLRYENGNENEDEDEDDRVWPSKTAVNAMRATCLRELGCRVDWSGVHLEPLPKDRTTPNVMDLGVISDDDDDEHWPLTQTLVRFCCLRY